LPVDTLTGLSFRVSRVHPQPLMNSEEYARLAGEYFPATECSSISLYAPVATRALELGLQVREGGNEAGPVTVLIGSLLRQLLVPARVCGHNAPPIDFNKLDRTWARASSKGRYLASISALQMLAATYVQNAWSLSGDAASRARRLGVMAREAHEMLDHLEVLAGHHGYALGDIAAWDLQSLAGRSAVSA
jgi:hypothetical protein